MVLSLGETDCTYLLVLDGEVAAGGLSARKGDALALEGPGECRLGAPGSADILLIETGKRE